MSNSYFQFKQFTVYQQHCAMKVCTDACLFGSWVAGFNTKNEWNTALDIGTGTGLLSLMVAQNTSAEVTAIEIEESAFQQATDNFHASPWPHRLHAIHQDVRTFNPGHTFDLIISNPPFFEDDLLSRDSKKNVALHSTHLSAIDLIEKADQLLAPNGQLALLLPYHRGEFFKQVASANALHVQNVCNVRQTENHPFFRTMFCFSRQQQLVVAQDITIKENGQYSTAFRHLLQAYYLHL